MTLRCQSPAGAFANYLVRLAGVESATLGFDEQSCPWTHGPHWAPKPMLPVYSVPGCSLCACRRRGEANMALAEPRNVARLREAIKGTVILPGDAAYDDARATFNAMIDRRPRLIVRCASVPDVARAVTFAADEGLPVSVRGGGHAVAGHCIGDGAVVVDLAGLKQVEVDPARRRAVAGGGVIWEEFDPVCLEHGLATTGRSEERRVGKECRL